MKKGTCNYHVRTLTDSDVAVTFVKLQRKEIGIGFSSVPFSSTLLLFLCHKLWADVIEELVFFA